MTTERKLTLLLIPFQTYCALALFGMLLYGAAYGHMTKSLLIMVLAFASFPSWFLWLIGAAILAHFRLTRRASVNTIVALAWGLAAAFLMPSLAR